MVWYGMVEVCEGAPVAVSGWALTDWHDLAPCAANSLHRATISLIIYPGAREHMRVIDKQMHCTHTCTHMHGMQVVMSEKGTLANTYILNILPSWSPSLT